MDNKIFETPRYTKNNPSPKQRIYRLGVRLVILLGVLFVVYYGYCWGWWGKNSLLLQYIFQCGCLISSNESRYPDSIDVIIPACEHDSILLSPSGRLLYIDNYIFWNNFSYFLNIETGEKTQYRLPGAPKYFLTDNFMFYQYDEYIFDRVTSKKYPITKFENWRPEAYTNGITNLDLLSESLQNAKQVFLVSNEAVVAISNDFTVYPENNFFINRSGFPGNDTNRIEQFLKENNIEYIFIPEKYSHETKSSNGRFIARDDGIYLSETEQKIVEGFSPTGEYRPASGKYFWVVGWAYNGSAAMYSKKEEVCLIEMNIFVSDVCIFRVPQPVLLLKVPQEYLDGTIP